MRTQSLAGLLTCLAIALSASSLSAQTVKVAQGQIEGKAEGKVTAYLGIPFAAPPVGDLRWQPPTAPAAWSGIRAADHFSASCEQSVNPQGFGPWTSEYVVSGAVSEDCLYLNVWTPTAHPKKPMAVLVFIHGGAFNSGSGSVPIYDGAKLAEQGIVVVNLNYRVGVYGFMAHPDLTKESPHQASGNYGLMDQIAALRWIQANIRALGGDPDRVTISGQSAGAASVVDLIASPEAKGLFHGAIAESGAALGIDTPARSDAETIGLKVQALSGATSLADMRKLSTADLDAAAAKAGDGLAFKPVVDGWILPDAATATANTNDVAILTGITADEGAGLPMMPDATLSDADKTFKRLEGRGRALAALYLWAEPRLAGATPVYVYVWSHPEPGANSAYYGAFHSSELPYVFQTLDTGDRPFTAEDRRLATTISGYWVNFVKTGNPNGKGMVAWPKLTAGRQILDIGDKTRVEPMLDEATLKHYRDIVAGGGKIGLFQ